MNDEQRYQFKESTRKEINDMSLRSIDSHFLFIKQLLTISVAGIGFVGILIRGEDVDFCEAKTLRLVIITLSLCTLFSLIYLFCQKYIYNELKRLMKEHRNKVLDGNTPDENNVYAKISKLYVWCEGLSYFFFAVAVFFLVLYSVGATV